MEEEGQSRVVERYIVSAPVAGRLLRVTLEEDDPVQAEKVVAHIDPLPMASRVEEVEAEIRALRERVAGVEVDDSPDRVDIDQIARAVELVVALLAEHALELTK